MCECIPQAHENRLTESSAGEDMLRYTSRGLESRLSQAREKHVRYVLKFPRHKGVADRAILAKKRYELG